MKSTPTKLGLKKGYTPGSVLIGGNDFSTKASKKVVCPNHQILRHLEEVTHTFQEKSSSTWASDNTHR